MMHEKIGPHHLERKVILYVRQSSAHQVLHNRESSTLQYAMRDRLVAFGWSSIETIDDDLGRSAAGGVARAVKQRPDLPPHLRAAHVPSTRALRITVSSWTQQRRWILNIIDFLSGRNAVRRQGRDPGPPARFFHHCAVCHCPSG